MVGVIILIEERMVSNIWVLGTFYDLLKINENKTNSFVYISLSSEAPILVTKTEACRNISLVIQTTELPL